MSVKRILVLIIGIICMFSLAYGIYFEIIKIKPVNVSENDEHIDESEVTEFDKLFNNTIDYQNYEIDNGKKANTVKEFVYTGYTLTEKFEDKYDIKVNIPCLNINSKKTDKINKEISKTFQEKVNYILEYSNKTLAKNTIYTVQYTAVVNDNILSLVIKSTIKEGNSTQKTIIKTYNYNIDTDEEVTLSKLLDIKGVLKRNVTAEINKTVQEGITKASNLKELGYNVYERDISSTMYEIENSDNFFYGTDKTIYIIYAYGNVDETSEKDIVVIK